MLRLCMGKWRTSLFIGRGPNTRRTNEILIRRGIFQGDSLSPLWFCLALNPLSHLLQRTPYGYIIDRKPMQKISHHFYMDDLKLYAKNSDELQKVIKIVKNFSDGIRIEFCLD